MADSNDSKTRTVGRDTIRSRLVLEVASEMVDQPEWRYRQARISLRERLADRSFRQRQPSSDRANRQRRGPGSDDQSRRPAGSGPAR